MIAETKNITLELILISGAVEDLIFVTDITDYIRGEKSVMWKNFRFL